MGQSDSTARFARRKGGEVVHFSAKPKNEPHSPFLRAKRAIVIICTKPNAEEYNKTELSVLCRKILRGCQIWGVRFRKFCKFPKSFATKSRFFI